MKIAMVVDAYNKGNGGCVATMRLVEGLKKRGHEFNIVATKSLEKKNFFPVKGFYMPGTEESQANMDFQFGLADKNVLRKAFSDVDLVQIQFPFFLGHGAAKIARSMKKNVIGAYHVQPQNILGAMGKESRFFEFVIGKLFNFFLFNRVPLTQCPSQFAADHLRKSGCRKTLKVVSNGIPADYAAKKHARPKWFGDKLVLMNVGRHALEKRQTLLVEGVKRSKYADKIQLLLCGKGEMSETLIKNGAELPVKPFVQYVTHEEKLEYLNTADLYVHASMVELESLSCLEAIGCGLPCLIGDSRYSAAPQFALDKRFIFTFDDADSLAAKIDYWYEHRGELKTSRKKALEMAEKYRFEKCLDEMEAMYAEVLRTSKYAKQLPNSGGAGVLAPEAGTQQFHHTTRGGKKGR
ncbi:MAG: glycosyltransferase [Spirochaetota bacterium]